MNTHANFKKIFLIRVFWFKYIFTIKLKIRILDLMLLPKTSVPFEGLYYSNTVYQSPLILTELFQHDLINVSYLTACYLYQVMMTLYFLNGVAYDAESIQTSKIRHDS